MSDSVRPHRQQPTRLPRPWGSPGKNAGVGCHFLLQCMKVKSESEIPRLVGAQFATGDQWRNNSRKNEGMEPKQKQYPVVDVTAGRSKV